MPLYRCKTLSSRYEAEGIIYFHTFFPGTSEAVNPVSVIELCHCGVGAFGTQVEGFSKARVRLPLSEISSKIRVECSLRKLPCKKENRILKVVLVTVVFNILLWLLSLWKLKRPLRSRRSRWGEQRLLRVCSFHLTTF